MTSAYRNPGQQELRRVARVGQALIAAAALMSIVYFGVFYSGQLPDHRLVRGWNDVVLHAAAFALLVSVVVPQTRARLGAILAIVALAGAIEILQIPLPRRSASLRDFAASLAGIALGLAVMSAGGALKSKVFLVTPKKLKRFG